MVLKVERYDKKCIFIHTYSYIVVCRYEYTTYLKNGNVKIINCLIYSYILIPHFYTKITLTNN